MRIIGIDPGYAITGYAVLDYKDSSFKVCDYGLVKTSKDTPFPERLLTIDRSIEMICEVETGRDGDRGAVFLAQYYDRDRTAQARGVAIVAAARRAIPVYEYTPMQVKVAVTGYGKAEKQQVQEMVRIILKLKEVPKPDDVADALAIAICHGHSGNRRDALAVSGYQ